MLDPFEHEIESIALVAAHGGLKEDNGNRIYSIAAAILTPDGNRKKFESLIRYAHFTGRDHYRSGITKDMLRSAPDVAEVKVSLKRLLAGQRFMLVFDPADVLEDIIAICRVDRCIDLGFSAEFFYPHLGVATPKIIWEHLHGKERDKVFFHATELVDLSILLLDDICSTILNDQKTPQATTIRYYLNQSATLFGTCYSHLARRYKKYFGGLFDICTVQDTPDWKRCLPKATPPKKKKRLTKEVYKPVSQDQIERLYKGIAESGRGFRFRPEQVQFGGQIAEALNDSAVLTIEAGTGTGKTQGYLIPALEFLYRNRDARIVISTYTKNLQEQIFQRELPFTKEIFPQYRDIPVALLKGKSSYLCADKLDSVYEEGLRGRKLLTWLYFLNIIFNFHRADADAIGEKVKQYLDGDYSLARTLQEISAKDGCPAKHLRCPAQVVGGEAAKARLVITNHHKLALLDSDGLLSGLFRNYIIDEANHFENAVRDAFGEEVASREIDGIIAYLDQNLQKVQPKSSGLVREDIAAARSAMEQVRQTIAELRDSLLGFHPLIHSGGSHELQFDHPSFRKGRIDHLIQLLKTELKLIGKRIEFVKEESLCRLLKIQHRTAQRILIAAGQLDEAAGGLKTIETSILHRNKVSAYQLFRKHWILAAHSVDVTELIQRHFFEQKDAIVFTAATISHRDRFDCFQKITGQDTAQNTPKHQTDSKPIAKEFRFQKIPSPFSKNRMEITIHPEAVSGRYDNKEAWTASVVALLPGLIRQNKGRTLVLFSSYSDLELIAKQVEGPIIEAGYPLLLQRPDVPTRKLCDEFRAIKESVLFGVDTFWYGVDFKGDTLTQVIITRMPFPHATSPIQLVRKRTLPPKDYWERYYYDANIKTRQGIGRLIRCDTDKGKVIFLDSRFKPEDDATHGIPYESDDPPTTRLFTIGHSTHSAEKFIELLTRHGIDAVADVRSSPYSKFNPQFNRDILERTLEANHIAYRFLGKELGPRSDDSACCKDGKMSYPLLSATPLFRQGLHRLRNGMAQYRIALMCAERDPIACHRMILICGHIRFENIEIHHILADGDLESNGDAEKRLLHQLQTEDPSRFEGSGDPIEQAYRIQAEKIAYTPAVSKNISKTPTASRSPRGKES